MDQLVSVVIPTFNRAKLILRAIQSVLNQTYQNFEIIVVDDGSTDGTEEVIKSVKNSSNRILYFYQQNKGRSCARNIGVNLSSGEYIAFLDSDDQFLPKKISEQVSCLNQFSEVGMVYSLVYALYEGASTKMRIYNEKILTGNIYPDLLFIRKSFITTPSVMVRRKVIEDIGLFNETLSVCEDLDLWRRIAKKYSVFQIIKPLSIISIRNNNQLISKEILEARKGYYLLAFGDDKYLSPIIKKKLFMELYEYCAMNDLREKNFIKVKEYLLLAYNETPYYFLISIISLGISVLAIIMKMFLSKKAYTIARSFYRKYKILK